MAKDSNWEAIDLSRTSKQAWNENVSRAEAAKDMAEKVHNLRCRTGDFDLDAEYEDCMTEYAGHIAILRLAAPAPIAELGKAAHAEAISLEPQLRETWRRQDQATEFVKVSARYVRLLDQCRILKGGNK